jgi:WD40 repeat protein
MGCADDRTIRIWDAVTGMVLHTLEGHTGTVNSVAFSSDRLHIVSGSGDNTVRIWDAISGVVHHTWESHTGSVNSVTFSSDGLRIASGDDDETVYVWNALLGVVLHTMGHETSVRSVAFSSDGLRILSGDDSRYVCIWDALSGEELHNWECWMGTASSAAFSPDGSRIVLASGNDNTVRIWNAEKGPDSDHCRDLDIDSFLEEHGLCISTKQISHR